MSEKIKPALTAEEWETRLAAGFAMMLNYDMGQGVVVPLSERHAIAALALYNQPFGFTREDVKLLRDEDETIVTTYEAVKRFQALADRIEALLPPEGT